MFKILCVDKPELENHYRDILAHAVQCFGKQNCFNYRELHIILRGEGAYDKYGETRQSWDDTNILEIHLPTAFGSQGFEAAHFHLFAHEVLHTLRFKHEIKPSCLEEGVACWFANYYINKIKYRDQPGAHCNYDGVPGYSDALKIYSSLHTLNCNFIKSILNGNLERSISEIDANEIADHFNATDLANLSAYYLASAFKYS